MVFLSTMEWVRPFVIGFLMNSTHAYLRAKYG